MSSLKPLGNTEYESLKIKTKKITEVNFCVLFFLEGFIDQQNLAELQEEIDKALASGYINFIFDFEEISYIASATLGIFADLQESVSQYGGAIVFAELTGKALEVFTLLGFYDFYPVADGIDQAIEYLIYREDEEPEEVVEVFPRTIQCPICSTKLRATKPGKFKCPNCKTILGVTEDGQVILA